MAKNSVAALLLCVLTALPRVACAQSPEETEALMDEVRLSEAYIYGEGYDSDPAIAYDDALSDLTMTANELRGEKGLGMLKPSDLQTEAQELKYTRGGRSVAFLYLPLSLATTLTGRSHSQVLADDGKSGSEPSPGQPRPAEQSAEQPTEQPVEQPVEQPAVTPMPVPDDITETLCGQDNWTEIKGFLTEYKKTGKIKETGVCQSAHEVPEDAIAILIDDMYGILSILSPRKGGERINYRTDQPDSEANYSNCKVIVWYR